VLENKTPCSLIFSNVLKKLLHKHQCRRVLPWRWKHHAPLKHRLLWCSKHGPLSCSELHVVFISQFSNCSLELRGRSVRVYNFAPLQSNVFKRFFLGQGWEHFWRHVANLRLTFRESLSPVENWVYQNRTHD